MWAVLPIKNLENVKSRLAPSLSLPERVELFRSMVEDVIFAVSRVPAFDGILVVTRDPDIQALAASFGASVLKESSNDGHDMAVFRAARWLLARGHTGLMQLPGDIPTVTPDELSDVLAVHSRAQTPRHTFTISPSHDYGGSNCVVCSPPDVVSLKFGEDSFRRHLTRARLAGVESRVVEHPGIALDIDNPKDLARLAAMPGTTRTHRFLDHTGIGRRVIESIPRAAKDRMSS
jgi:2-phospho-L-lactate guanylyltransferase